MNTKDSLDTQTRSPEDMTEAERRAEIEALEAKRRRLTMILNGSVEQYEKESGKRYPTHRPKRG